MKLFVVADVHGFYDEMRQALNDAGFDPSNSDHFFVSCGDALDRGHQPREVLEFIHSLDPMRTILIRGNHEDLMEEAIIRHSFASYDRTNGTAHTAMDLTGTQNEFDALAQMRSLPLYNDYIIQCGDYAEVGDYIFVHGWIPCVSNRKLSGVSYIPIEDWRNASREEWSNARWYNGMDAWSFGVKESGKTIVCGHWHTSWGHAYLHNNGSEFPSLFGGTNMVTDPFVDKGIIALDACTAFSHRVNCVVLEV